MRRGGISVVIPVFNATESLPELLERLEAVLERESADFEVILVNDGSTDKSWQVIANAAETRKWVRGINLSRNYGQHNALLCGIRSAVYPVIVTMDDDLQHPPEEITRILAALEHADVVYGTPHSSEHSRGRNLASRITKLALQRAMGVENASSVSAFRAIKSHVIKAFEGYRGSFVSIDVLLTWGTSSFTHVSVDHRPRKFGRSGYRTRDLTTQAFNLLTGFSTFPLQLASILGFTFVLVGGILLIFVLTRWAVSGTTVPGFTFLATVITMFAGAQLFALGVIGEYLARVHFRILDKPAYTIRNQVP